jgi:50S ribosomal protein L16 3-hydroxylase
MAKKTPSTTRKSSPATGAKSAAAPAPPFEVDASSAPPLGMPAARFLETYWQKHPLLIRNAFPGMVSPIEPEDLAGLACEEGTLARIVEHDRERDAWTLRTGPFDEEMFPGMPHQDWTLLVQDVDKWDDDVARLLEAFAFLPRWRIDDIMVSFAAPGGSVGAHVDQYDVFLLQAQGHRHWQIDASDNPDTTFRNDVELKLLRQFNPTHDWVLGPGDMLYLPPGVPHHGVARDACLTFSVGMRAPAAAELLGDFVDTLAADADEAVRFRDPDLMPAKDPAEIDDAAMARAVAALNALRMNDPERLGDWFGRFITLYRNAGEVMAPPDERSRIQVEWDLQQGARLQRHPWSRMAWRKSGRQARLYVNGAEHGLPVRDAKCVANARELDAAAYESLSQAGRDCVFELLQAGHYRLDGDHPEDGGEDE